MIWSGTNDLGFDSPLIDMKFFDNTLRAQFEAGQGRTS